MKNMKELTKTLERVIVKWTSLSLCVEVYAEGEQEVKRGLFPFMAFLYYPDETIVDGAGARFLRAAVLIRADWLVTSAISPSVSADGPNGFPRKTLLARAGAVVIDNKFTLNEDEDEQEREIIQIVRPYNHSATQWWHTDISLMKTLLPFNMTSAVGVIHLNPNREYEVKTCTILIYTKSSNSSDERTLIQLGVELLPPSVENCGSHFVSKTMTCASDSDDSKHELADPNFCQGNRGGPLICEGEVMALQTYIDNDCKQPHLYQLLSVWDNFITCATENTCREEKCTNICDVTNKDPPETDAAEASTDKEVIVQSTDSTVTDVQVTTYATYDTTAQEVEGEQTPSPTATSEELSTADQLSTEATTSQSLANPSSSDKEETTETANWPKEKYPDARKSMDDIDSSNRKPSVEAQQQVKAKVRSAGQTIVLNYSIFFGYFILACLI
ncbi:uncharacterized protein LOC142974202 [Anticarsia gemmatalis]|uniref:uncharacterized protein LOC142974202 n=1 Tax=Anticarsia gemmatalis TaxID=129554 RepID=UPI003F770821